MARADQVLIETAPDLEALAELPASLTGALEAETVGAALHDAVPELRSGVWTLERCESKLRVKDDGWTAAVRLTVRDSGGSVQTVRLSGSFDPGVGLDLAPEEEDVGLPALADLIEPERARSILASALEIELASCTPEIMRYKPGSRCTVRYQLDYAGANAGPRSVVAKTYRGTKGENAYAGMAALDAAAIPASVVTLAPALAYDTKRKVLIQGAVPEETTLKRLARAAGVSGAPDEWEAVRVGAGKAAEGLAALHASGIVHGEVVTWEDQRADVVESVDRLAGVAPHVMDGVRRWLDRLAAVAASHPADPPGPAHRSFRPAQVLLSNDQISFIDFDGLCMSEPAMDVALFRVALRDAALRDVPADVELRPRLEAVDAIAETFLDRYAARRPISRERVHLWETMYLVDAVLNCWAKVMPERLAKRMIYLRRHLDRTR